MRHLISYPTIRGWLSHLQRDKIAGRCRRTPGGSWCPPRMGTAVDDEFPSAEMPTATNHQKEISSEGVLRDTWTHTCWNWHCEIPRCIPSQTLILVPTRLCHSQEGQWNSSLQKLQRNLRKAPTAVKTRTYESLIRPILEYSGVVWDPHTAQDVNKLEMVQHRYARYTSRDYGRTISVTAMLKTLGWEPLAERRVKARITMMYSVWSCWHPGIGPHHTGTCKQKDFWFDLIYLAFHQYIYNNAQFRVPYAQTLAYQRGFFPTARACGTPSQMRLQKQRASTPLRNDSPSFASDVEITPAPCK